MELSAMTVFSFPLPGGQLDRSWAQSRRGVFFNAVTGCNPVNGLFTHDTAFQPCQCFTAMMPVWCRYIRRWLFQGSGQQKSTSPVFSVGWCLTNRFMSALINRQGKLSQVSQPSAKRFGWHYKEKRQFLFVVAGVFLLLFQYTPSEQHCQLKNEHFVKR